MDVKILELKLDPVNDPYNTGQLTKTVLEINPEARTASITQRYHDNSIPAREWNGLDLMEYIDTSNGYLYPCKKYLEGAGQELLKAVCDGHSIKWDGNNLVGHLSDEAQNTLDELVDDLNWMATREYTLWQVDEWCDSVTITGCESDNELKNIAAELKGAIGSNEGVSGDILEYITARRDECISG
jgi:hypothetical protein